VACIEKNCNVEFHLWRNIGVYRPENLTTNQISGFQAQQNIHNFTTGQNCSIQKDGAQPNKHCIRSLFIIKKNTILYDQKGQSRLDRLLDLTEHSYKLLGVDLCSYQLHSLCRGFFRSRSLKLEKFGKLLHFLLLLMKSFISRVFYPP
jgi:hypothetical protein